VTATATATDLPLLSFTADLPGFPDRRRFFLTQMTDDGQMYQLRCLDDDALSFIVVASTVFPDYTPESDDEVVDLLELTTADDGLVFLMVSVGERVEEATVNLMAPLVVNRHTLVAAQVVLAGSAHPLRRPLRAA
jgi:flagellar assembly factor FliW